MSTLRIRRSSRHASCGGYILIEAVVALVLLSVGAYAVHGTLRQAILTRGQAQDYTQVRFALQQVVSELELQPMLNEEERSGRFPGELERFAWRYTISRVALPLPPEVMALPPEQREFAYPKGQDFLTRVHLLAPPRCRASPSAHPDAPPTRSRVRAG